MHAALLYRIAVIGGYIPDISDGLPDLAPIECICRNTRVGYPQPVYMPKRSQNEYALPLKELAPHSHVRETVGKRECPFCRWLKRRGGGGGAPRWWFTPMESRREYSRIAEQSPGMMKLLLQHMNRRKPIAVPTD